MTRGVQNAMCTQWQCTISAAHCSDAEMSDVLGRDHKLEFVSGFIATCLIATVAFI